MEQAAKEQADMEQTVIELRAAMERRRLFHSLTHFLPHKMSPVGWV